MKRFIITLGLLSILCISTCRAAEIQAKPPHLEATVTVDEVLWWLPEDTETVAVTHNAENLYSDEKKPHIYLGVAGLAMGGIKRGAFTRLFQTTPTSFIIEGSRKFRNTRGFGMLPFEGCSVIITKSDLPEENDLQKWLSKNASRSQSIFGHTTYIFDEKIEQDTWHLLVVQATPNVWLCATNKPYLESILRRRVRSKTEREKTRRALPPTLPEWKQINTSARTWALRHFRKDQAKLDPTSPLSGDQRMANLPDKDAIGLTYIFDEQRNVANIRYLTKPSNTGEMVSVYTNFWNSLIGGMGGVASESKKWGPTVRAKLPGVVEMRFDFSNPNGQEKAGMFSFGLLALFGHAIIV